MADDNKTGEIWVNKFDEESAREFRDAVVYSSKMDPSRPIIVYIDSYGGMVDSLAKMIETMDEVPNPIVTVCMGKAMSCGAILLSHGDVRFCGKHSRIMVHEVSSGSHGDVHDMHADVQEVKRLNEYFIDLLAKNCGYKGYQDLRKIIKEQDGRDRYMDATSALKFGIVDAIGLPKLQSMTMFEISTVKEKVKLSRESVKPLQSKKLKKQKESIKQNNKSESKDNSGRKNVRQK